MNARRPLAIAASNSTGQWVHPDVAVDSSGLSGYRLIMVGTPYPFGNDRLENPSLRVSNDGLTWNTLAGVPDPLVAPPDDPDAHHADPDLVLAGGRAYVVYMTRNKRENRTTFSVIESDNLRDWARPRVIYEDQWGVSPAVAHRETGWSMWYVRLDVTDPSAEARLLRRDGPSLFSLGEPRTCDLTIDGWVPWHLDIIATVDGWEALVAAYPVDLDNSRTSLFHCTSADGIVFKPSRARPVIRPSRLGWDAMMVYRSSFLKSQDSYRIWYTGGSWNRRFGIGYLEGPLERLEDPGLPLGVGHRAGYLADNIVGLAKVSAKRVLRPVALSVRRRMVGRVPR